MRILVACASRMGSTAEIAERIAAQVRAAGHQVETGARAEAPGADGYDAVVPVSALDVGRWDATATGAVPAPQLSGSRRLGPFAGSPP